MPRLLQLTPLALALVLTGCALKPAASPEPVKLPAQYLAQANEADAASATMANWWNRYQDPELLRLIGLANAHNQDIAVSLAQYDKAIAVLGAAQAQELPSLSGSTSSARQSNNTAKERVRSSTHSVSGLASFELDMWGRLSNATKSDAQSAEAAREHSRHTQNFIRNAVVKQYWSVRQLDALSEVIAKQIDARRQQLTISEQQLAFGVTSELDVQQAKADLASLERSRISTKTSRDSYLQSLVILVGIPDLTLSGGTGIAEPLAAPIMGLPSLLLQQRPDIKQAENQLQAAGFEVAVARAAMFPSIGLSAQGGGRSASLSNLTGAGSSFWALGYTLDLPLFDGGYRLSQIDQAKAAQREVAALYQKSILTAFSDVNQALIETEGWNKQTPWMQDELEAAQKAMDFALRKYAVGTVDYSTVLDTQKSLLDAEKSSVEIRYGKLISQANLYYALGY